MRREEVASIMRENPFIKEDNMKKVASVFCAALIIICASVAYANSTAYREVDESLKAEKSPGFPIEKKTKCR